MSFKILITGPPRCGKSTLIRKLLIQLNEDHSLYGFLTPEVRKNGKRIGFDLKDINSGEKIPLARKGKKYDSNYKLGTYNIFIKDFNQYLSKKNYLSTKTPISILIIDEIGKMELFSELFQSILKDIFTSNLPVIATIGRNLNHPIQNFILNIGGVKIYSLNRENQENVLNEVIQTVHKSEF
ncbi:MAG: hypothetical protein EU541_02230 [Promethearchaeota archaeon]|nr:MAG: hypothetical protein EU541_02230 [Candidatus Lokiarchaeota archaeon]